MRLHELGLDALAQMADQEPSVARWAELLEQLVDQMLANRKIFLLHERNQAAFEAMHREEHDAKHVDLQEQVRRVLADERLSVRDRVRMSASFGAVMGAVLIAGDAFDAVSSDELGGILRGAVRDLLG
jgi:hypothetical protein